MTNKLDLFGGTNWVDGDILFSEDLIEAFTNAAKFLKVYSKATSFGGRT